MGWCLGWQTDESHDFEHALTATTWSIWAGDGGNVPSCLCSTKEKSLDLQWCVFSPSWSSVPSLIVLLLDVPSIKGTGCAVLRDCIIREWGDRVSSGDCDLWRSTGHGPGSRGTPWWLFCFFIFFKHFKTNPVIYVPPDICMIVTNLSLCLCEMVNVIASAAVTTYTEILFLTGVFCKCSADRNKMALQCSLKVSTRELFWLCKSQIWGSLVRGVLSAATFSSSCHSSFFCLGNMGPGELFSELLASEVT